MKLATWNVNSIRSRLERVVRWLERERPDALCLQELKCTEEQFPELEIRATGYRAAVYGQKTYNGVAILSKATPENVVRGFGDDDEEDDHARLVSAEIDGVRVISAYFPNGKRVGSKSWHYKLAWMRRLRRFLDRTATPAEPLVLAGDFNVAPDDRDVANPDKWRPSVLCHEEARAALAHVADWGLIDAFRSHHPDGGVYSWWDYRFPGFPKNDGLRIDHVFVSEALSGASTDAWVDRDERKGKKTDKPSDHAPVVVELAR